MEIVKCYKLGLSPPTLKNFAPCCEMFTILLQTNHVVSFVFVAINIKYILKTPKVVSPHQTFVLSARFI